MTKALQVTAMTLCVVATGRGVGHTVPMNSRSSQLAGATSPRADSVTVRGVRLHYVDWGGSGEPLIFLTANGGRPERQFDALAPQFTDRYRVLGLTRRGQGESEKPSSGYGTDSLARDITGFMDAMRIARATLVGHSIAGAEMTHLAATFPDRVRTLVYLDAANDYAQLSEISAEAKLEAPSDWAVAAVLEEASKSHPAYLNVRAPSLDIVVVYEAPWPVNPDDTPAYRRYTQLVFDKDYVGDQIRQFRTQMKYGEIVMLRNTDHVAFLHDPAQLKIVVAEMRRFLLKNGVQ
jgi:pimeloyl-ACP methyl ester carboxylesterase